MADNTVVYDKDKEPATTHDVAEGGVIGALGGAAVGALAGGPVGAVVGAVVGAAASAGAVDVVDKRDHDYVETQYPGTAVTGDDPLVDEEDDLVAVPANRRTVI